MLEPPCAETTPAPPPVRVIVVDDPRSHFGTVETWGLADTGLPELEVREVRQFLLPQAVALVRRLAGYCVAGGGAIRAGQTVRFAAGSVVRLEPAASESGRDVATLALIDAPDLRGADDARCDHLLCEAEPEGAR